MRQGLVRAAQQEQPSAPVFVVATRCPDGDDSRDDGDVGGTGGNCTANGTPPNTSLMVAKEAAAAGAIALEHKEQQQQQRDTKLW